MYTFNESTRITRASDTWSCHRNYFQTILYKSIHEWRYAKSLHCRLVIVPIGKHNTDVLSTTAVNDLVMIVYYDPYYTHRSSGSKEGFRQKCWYRSGGTFCCHNEWTTSANVPIPAHSIVSYLGPEQSRAIPMMHALNWHEEINMGILKSCPTCSQRICRFDGLHIYICSGCIWHNWTCSQTTVMF